MQIQRDPPVYMEGVVMDLRKFNLAYDLVNQGMNWEGIREQYDQWQHGLREYVVAQTLDAAMSSPSALPSASS